MYIIQRFTNPFLFIIRKIVFYPDICYSAVLIAVLKRLPLLYYCVTWNITKVWIASNKPWRVRLFSGQRLTPNTTDLDCCAASWLGGRVVHLKNYARRMEESVELGLRRKAVERPATFRQTALSLYWGPRDYETLQNDGFSPSLLDCSMSDMTANCILVRGVTVQQDDTSSTNKPSPVHLLPPMRLRRGPLFFDRQMCTRLVHSSPVPATRRLCCRLADSARHESTSLF
jgi:hypothetical protein